jgi:hypothetical protein
MARTGACVPAGSGGGRFRGFSQRLCHRFLLERRRSLRLVAEARRSRLQIPSGNHSRADGRPPPRHRICCRARRSVACWYLDGGLLNPLPVWAAVELGATHIVALNALPEVPTALLRPFVNAFRAVFGHRPPLPAGIELVTLSPSRRLGSMRDAMRWKQDNIERWILQGEADAKNISFPNCLER